MNTISNCLNCAHELGDKPGNYCPNCGQETALHPPTVREFAHEFIGHYVALEGRLWKTLGLLFFKPAELTREYLAGRKRRYVLPLRLYLTASLLFFFIVKFAGISGTNTMNKEDRAALDSEIAQGVGDLRKGLSAIPDLKLPATDAIDCNKDTTACTKIKAYLARKYPGMTMEQVHEQIRHKLISLAPYAAFLLLPVFALLTRVLYWRRGMLYGEHLVYALHIHAFAFFALLLLNLLPEMLVQWLLWAMFIYFFIGLQRFFHGRWWLNVIRYFIIGTIYPLAMSGVILLSLLYAVFV